MRAARARSSVAIQDVGRPVFLACQRTQRPRAWEENDARVWRRLGQTVPVPPSAPSGSFRLLQAPPSSSSSSAFPGAALNRLRRHPTVTQLEPLEHGRYLQSALLGPKHAHQPAEPTPPDPRPSAPTGLSRVVPEVLADMCLQGSSAFDWTGMSSGGLISNSVPTVLFGADSSRRFSAALSPRLLPCPRRQHVPPLFHHRSNRI